jgi:putative lipoic acid-binding regulatory protein
VFVSTFSIFSSGCGTPRTRYHLLSVFAFFVCAYYRHDLQQDPADSSTDTERENGNILKAMLTFPLDYTFHVVGRTDGDDDIQERFVQQVKEIVRVQTTSTNEEMTCQITPRGTKFTKVTIIVTVVSSDVISSIYDQLGKLELSVMQF